jgi:hypothetical protein
MNRETIQAIPAIAKYVRGYGYVEIGDQESFGFVVRALGYGGLDFEDDTPETLAEAMAVLEAGLAKWFEEQGIDINWVQSVSLQRGDLPNSRPAWVIWRVPSGAFSTLEPVVGHYWPALGMKRTGAYPCRTAVRHTEAARSMLHGWST